MKGKHAPKNLGRIVRYLANPAVCHEYLSSLRWPGRKLVCPKCGGQNIGELKIRRLFKCNRKACQKQFSTKVGTIFEDSPLELGKWFVGIWCLVSTDEWTSSYELARALKITQKSAWKMQNRIRLAMQTRRFKASRQKRPRRVFYRTVRLTLRPESKIRVATPKFDDTVGRLLAVPKTDFDVEKKTIRQKRRRSPMKTAKQRRVRRA